MTHIYTHITCLLVSLLTIHAKRNTIFLRAHWCSPIHVDLDCCPAELTS